MRIVCLFDLKEGVSQEDYEAWAKSTDLPTVRGLGSINDFQVMRSAGVLGSDELAPYEYIEIIDVADMDQFGSDVATEVMQNVAAQFGDFADNPTFVLTDNIE